MNKTGASFSGWTEGILITILFVSVLISVVGGMNTIYGKNYQTGLSDNDTLTAFTDYADDASDEIEGGEADFTSAQGLTLSSSWDMIKTLLSVVQSFLTGSFIPTVFNYMKLPAIVGLVFRIIYVIGLFLVVLGVLFKRKI